MPKITNWSPIEGTNRAWKNDKTGTRVGLVYSNEVNRWEVITENQTIDAADTQEEARSLATDWMREHPTPGAMY